MLFKVGPARTAYIFHISRRKSDPLFLHPFLRRGAVLRVLSKSRIRGLFGSEPDLGAVYRFRNELYEQVNSAVRQWVGDVRFMPRFLYSVASFLVVYLALTLTSRISLPLSASLAVALVCGIVAYAAVSRRDLRSQIALKKRIALRGEIDGILFEQSEFVRAVEEELAAIESGDRPADSGVFRELVELYPAESRHLRQYLDDRLPSRRRRDGLTGASRGAKTGLQTLRRLGRANGGVRFWIVRRFLRGSGRHRSVPKSLTRQSWAEAHLRSAGLVGAEEGAFDQFLIDVASGEPVSSNLLADFAEKGKRYHRSSDEALALLRSELERALTDPS
ncbi:hypothetical protein [Salinispira pacifica]